MRFVGSDGRGGSDRLDPACDTRAVGGWTAIVLAGSRNERDLLAAHFEVTSKALVPLGGEPMVGRVVSTLLSCPSVGRVVIVAQDPHNLCRGELEWIAAAPGVSLVESPHGIGTSLAQLAGTEATPLPVLVTTADHPLLTSDMVEHFISESSSSDVTVGVVERPVMEAAYPETRRTWMRFRGGDYTGANLFAVRTQGATAALQVLAKAEGDRKSQLKLLWHFGPLLALGAWTRALSLKQAIERGGRRFGLKAAAVPLPFAEAGIDVDRLGDWQLADRILRERSAPACPKSERAGISVFDLDRTLTRRGTYTSFLVYCALRRSPWRLLLAPVALVQMGVYALGGMTRKRLKEQLHGLLLGARIDRREVDRFAQDFARRLRSGGLYSQGIRRLEQERSEGRRIVLATAANAFYVGALARELEIGEVVSTQSVWDGDHLVPRIDGDNCYGLSKLAMLEEHFGRDGNDRQSRHVRFFSDHHSDSVVLHWADEAYVVNPAPRFRAYAAQAGWNLLDWR